MYANNLSTWKEHLENQASEGLWEKNYNVSLLEATSPVG